MLTFNNDHIFTGYLKQLLFSYYLTKYRVYTTDDTVIQSGDSISGQISQTQKWQLPVQNTWYIKNGLIQKYSSENSWQQIKTRPTLGEYAADHYLWIQNRFDLNHVKTLQIKNNIYDSYTHEYLGDFLRFLRDYHKLDLMRLYNCFSNRLVDELQFEVHGRIAQTGIITKFSTNDNRYKIYAVPARLFNNYTIAIDCPESVQICCTIWNSYVKNILDAGIQLSAENTGVRLLVQSLRSGTYKRFTNCKFSQPLVYSYLNVKNRAAANAMSPIYTHAKNLAQAICTQFAVQEKEDLLKIYQNLLGYLAANQSDLYMLIKVPAANKSSITILQGDYSNFNNAVPTISLGNRLSLKTNYYHIPQQQMRKELEEACYISPCQLLKFNTGVSYPFADRLMQYLLGQPITQLQSIGDNVKRVQAVMYLPSKLSHTDGIWIPQIRNELYAFMMMQDQYKRASQLATDSMGWVDKDVEALYYNQRKNEQGEVIIARQLMSCDIYQPNFDDRIQEVS